MKTQNINNHKQNFTGIYKIPHTNKAFLKLVQNKVVPLYEIVRNKPAYVFQGNSPFDSALEKVIRGQVEKEGNSYQWFIQNAKNHGINITDFNDVDTWVITGVDDIENLKPLFKKDKFPSLKKMICKAKRIIEIFNPDNSIPKHLRKFGSIIKRNNKHTENFRDLISDKKIIEVNNVENLIKEMMLEKYKF